MKTLTFYSGKLWHSDKPFPVKPRVDDAVFATLEAADYTHEVKSWLSTAYEVVNPEVIPGVINSKGTLKHDFGECLALVDGDELTLPDRYGIKCNEVPCIADPNTGECKRSQRNEFATVYHATA